MPARSMLVRLAVVVPTSGLAALIACGNSSPSKVIDAHKGGSDGGKLDGSGSASCALPATITPPTFSGSSCTATAGTECAFTEGSGSGYTQDIEWQATIAGTGSAVQYFSLDIFGGGGATDTPDWPTAVGPASNVNVSNGDVSLIIGTDVNGSGQPGVIYAAIGGTLTVTAASATAGQTFSGSFSNVMLQHYDFPQTGNPTPDPDGCKTMLTDTVSFSAPAEAPPTNPGGIRPFGSTGSIVHALNAANANAAQ